MPLLQINTQPTSHDLRVFAGCSVVLLTGVGWSAWRRGFSGLALFAWVSIAPFILLGLIRPPLLRPVYLFAVYLTFPIGIVVSYLLLTALYYGVFTPTGLLLRVLGKDPLNRRFDFRQKSYWESRTENAPPKSYFNQH